MPSRLHLVSIKPELNEDNQLSLKMTVAGDSRDQALELVKRMEESQSFRQTEIASETQGSLSGGDSVKFEIGALYVPVHEPRSAR
jgi:hypothetical protein